MPSVTAHRHGRYVPGPVVAQILDAPPLSLRLAPCGAQESGGHVRCKRDIKTVQRQAEPIPPSLYECLLARPAGEKCPRLSLQRQRAQRAHLSGREEALGDPLARKVLVVELD